jgi:hypothetical protein
MRCIVVPAQLWLLLFTQVLAHTKKIPPGRKEACIPANERITTRALTKELLQIIPPLPSKSQIQLFPTSQRTPLMHSHIQHTQKKNAQDFLPSL